MYAINSYNLNMLQKCNKMFYELHSIFIWNYSSKKWVLWPILNQLMKRIRWAMQKKKKERNAGEDVDLKKKKVILTWFEK